ncbi:EAL domain-containing protein [Synechococcus elongatus]|uniref:EAL domain-containing protein n=1 Tax=Synechococcus elongatus TaxID=32046 RepID=UPI000F7F7414|nr:EAL domain-containing protein [Synechococcus elongatus]
MEQSSRQFFEQISREDWEQTPESVQQLVRALLAESDLVTEESEQASTGRLAIDQYFRESLRYQQVVEAQTDLILRSRSDTMVVFANKPLCQVLGWQDGDISGQTWGNLVPPNDLSELHEKIAGLSLENPTFESLNRNYGADQRIKWIQWVNQGIFNDRGELVEIQSVGRDVTTLIEQITREKTLNYVFEAIRNSLDLEVIFATATKELAKTLNGLDCYIVQYLEEQRIWTHVAEFQHDENQESRLGIEIQDLDNPFAEQLKKFQVVRVENTQNINDKINRELAKSTPGAWLLVPLIVEEKLWGSFTIVSNQKPFIWSDGYVDLARSIARQLEIAIYQADLYQKIQQELSDRSKAELALQESQTRFQRIADNLPGIIYGYKLRQDGTDQFTYISSGFREVYGIDPETALENSNVVWGMIHPEDIEYLKTSIIKSQQTLKTWKVEYRIITKNGELKWMQGRARPTRQENGETFWDGLIIDISDRKKIEAELQTSEERYRLLAENMNDLVCLHQADGTYLYVSPSAEALLGFSSEEMVGQNPYDFFHPEDCDRIRDEAHQAVLMGAELPIVYRMRKKLGGYIWFETLTKPIMDDQGVVIGLQTTSRDVTQRIEIQNQLQYDACHDSLTGLANRNLLIERLELSLKRSKRLQNYKYAVLFLDLDRFKVINDSLGHITGDQLLVSIAQKLQSIIRSHDLAARLGGDEFVVLVEDIQTFDEPIKVAERILAAIQVPLELEERSIYTSTSIGIVFGSHEYESATQLLRDADTAMYRAKSRGRARYEVFDSAMHSQALARLHLENDLRQAIARQEFVLYYQPIIQLQTGKITGFEALIRWQHPTEGIKLPIDLIPIAEETGLITSIDYWVLNQACRQLSEWQASYSQAADLSMSVNLSAQNLQHDHLMDEIQSVLQATKIKPGSLTLEITESMLIENTDQTIQLLAAINEQGIEISIDDFGTGYSSLSYLHKLPVNNLKVDGSFVRKITTESTNYQIVNTIIALNNQLGLKAIAEGIETHEQLDLLSQLGYQYGQGYLFARPLNAKDVEQLFLSN